MPGTIQKSSRIYVSGHRGLVGSAILRALKGEGYNNILTRTRSEIDLSDAVATRTFFDVEKPEYVYHAAAGVGGILANSTRPGDFIRENLAMELNVIEASRLVGVRKLLFSARRVSIRDWPLNQ